ncbi:TriB protein [Klebsiella pneumoniae]|nr:TriB protein [Klebsiella pneumoniae]
MILFRKLKAVVPPVSACTLTTFSATPALADGFQRASLAAITITVAVIWIGYKTLWKGESLSQCGYIIIGGILIGGGSEIGALLMS